VTPTLRRQAEKLVDRARAGDQNAMGMIQEIGRNARAGFGAAAEPYRVIMGYIRANPAGPAPGAARAVMGAETAQSLSLLAQPVDPDTLLRVLCFIPRSGDEGVLEAACVLLAGGPDVDPPRVSAVQSRLPAPLHPAFQFGLGADAMKAGDLDAATVGAVCAGHCLGFARRVQGVVRRGMPLSFLHPDVGWEVGE
jgi:hypothetical protein